MMEYTESILEDSSRDLPLYTVGPATARSLTTLRDKYLPHASIHGADTGNGENLARFILDHYNALRGTGPESESQPQSQSQSGSQLQAQSQVPRETGPDKPPLLFLVGETRRDIIPKTLMGGDTPPARRIGVEEVVVYETGVVGGFEGEFGRVLAGLVRGSSRPTGDGDGDGDGRGVVVWVVVFSPTGCDAMVRVLKREVERGDAGGEERGKGRRIFVATIGPTTRDHLVRQCGFEPDVCAAKPSPEGVGAGIEEFMRGWSQ